MSQGLYKSGQKPQYGDLVSSIKSSRPHSFPVCFIEYDANGVIVKVGCGDDGAPVADCTLIEPAKPRPELWRLKRWPRKTTFGCIQESPGELWTWQHKDSVSKWDDMYVSHFLESGFWKETFDHHTAPISEAETMTAILYELGNLSSIVDRLQKSQNETKSALFKISQATGFCCQR